MAEKERFELSLRFTRTTPLAGEPLRPLGYFSMGLHARRERKMAEREGFEPPVPFGITGFQDQRHQPLGHPSVHHIRRPSQERLIIITGISALVNPSGEKISGFGPGGMASGFFIGSSRRFCCVRIEIRALSWYDKQAVGCYFQASTQP